MRQFLRSFLFCLFLVLTCPWLSGQAPRALAVERPVAPPDSRTESLPPGDSEAGRFPPAGIPQLPANSVAGDYVISAADTLEMTVFREPELTTRSKVASDGTVQLPLLGDVKVAGMTVREARELVRKKYDADYLVAPQIYLNVVDFAQRQFTILGQVAKPGAYEFPGGKPLTLLEAVAMAGGFTRTADRGKVSVKRLISEGREQTTRVNAKKLSGAASGSFELTSGDVIMVGESWF